jgi:hypothetical protein
VSPSATAKTLVLTSSGTPSPYRARPELDDQDVGGHEGHDDRRADQPQPQPAEKSAALSPTVVARIFIAQKNTVT